MFNSYFLFAFDSDIGSCNAASLKTLDVIIYLKPTRKNSPKTPSNNGSFRYLKDNITLFEGPENVYEGSKQQCTLYLIKSLACKVLTHNQSP